MMAFAALPDRLDVIAGIEEGDDAARDSLQAPRSATGMRR